MSVFAQGQQAIRDAAAAAVAEATAELEARITTLEEKILGVLQPTTDAAPAPQDKPARRPRGTTAGAGTAAASGSSS
jgi:hypothetical protein